MKKNSLGCFSFSALIAFMFTVLVSGVFFISSGSAMFSPGKLSHTANGEVLNGASSHADIENDCSACHVAPWSGDTMAERCQLCHIVIKVELASEGSLHGVLLEFNSQHTCRDCHPEHRGTNAPLTDMAPGIFPHELLGFSLASHQTTSEGARFKCADCHTDRINVLDPNVCSECHQNLDLTFMQAHIIAYGADCLACHDGVETYEANFDHTQTIFPLIGQHTRVSCVECHQNARSIADFKNAPENCIGCHQEDDVHKQSFGPNCATCHTPDSWLPVSFNHSLTSFPLKGKHQAVSCEECHTPGELMPDVPRDCYACHAQDDNHNGQYGTSCGACHTENAWIPTIFDHTQITNECIICHSNDDDHNGQYGADCNICHSTNAWHPANFDHALVTTECVSCHLVDDNHNGQFGQACATCHATTAWKPATFSHTQVTDECITCHLNDDEHQGQFGTDCNACHNTEAWKPVNFNHSLVSNDCSTCHLQDDNHNGAFGTSCGTCHNTNAWTPANFNHSQVSSNCSTCHLQDDSHNGKFGTDCGTCHSTNAWKPASFNHNLSNFPLTGAHINTACEACHATGTFSGLSTACVTCHTDPFFHQGAVGTNCASCHNTSVWVPASYNISHPVVADEGGRGIDHGRASCRTCHPSTVYNYTCLSCHSDNQGGEGGEGDDD